MWSTLKIGIEVVLRNTGVKESMRRILSLHHRNSIHVLTAVVLTGTSIIRLLDGTMSWDSIVKILGAIVLVGTIVVLRLPNKLPLTSLKSWRTVVVKHYIIHL